MTTAEQLSALIKKQFPGVWIKPGSHMGHDSNTLISGEGAIHNDMEVFNYWSEDYSEIVYRMKVLKEFADFVESHGYYVEFIDAGTVSISPE